MKDRKIGNYKVWLALLIIIPHVAQAQQGGVAGSCPPGQQIACPFDLNCDGTVNSDDVDILNAAWGKPGAADFNADNTVDGSDLAMQLGAWGSCPKVRVNPRLEEKRRRLYASCRRQIAAVRKYHKKAINRLKSSYCRAYLKAAL